MRGTWANRTILYKITSGDGRRCDATLETSQLIENHERISTSQTRLLASLRVRLSNLQASPRSDGTALQG